MRSMGVAVSTFTIAQTVAEALQQLATAGDSTTVLAGGTDLMVQHLRGERPVEHWLSVGHIEELRGVTSSIDGRSLRIGAATTHHVITHDERAGALVPALAAASGTVGGWQTQEAGTLGGNICNASPAADTPPPLLVAGAVVVLRSTIGERRVPLEHFLLGRRATACRPDELVVAVELEPLPPRAHELYVKVAPRTAMEVAVVGLAVRITLDDAEAIADARIAVGAVAPTALRVPDAEAALVGARLDDDAAVTAAGAALADAARPIDDFRATARYRRRVLAPLLRQMLVACRQRILLPEPSRG